MKELGEQNLAKAHYAAQTLGKSGKVLFGGAPRFNEFVLDLRQGCRAGECCAAREEDYWRIAAGEVVSGAWAQVRVCGARRS